MFQGFREKGKDSEKYPFGENMHLKFFIISFQTYFHSSFHSHRQATFSCPLWALLSDCSSFPCTCAHISLPPLLFSLFAPGYIYTWLICDMCLLLFSLNLSVILIHTRAWSRRYFTRCHRKMHRGQHAAKRLARLPVQSEFPGNIFIPWHWNCLRFKYYLAFSLSVI